MRKKNIFLFVISAIAFASCKKDSLDNLTSENIVTDNFSVSITDMDKLTDEKTYSYTCTKDTNLLTLGGTLSKGSFTIHVKDANANMIYSKENASLTGDVKQVVAPAGTWTVHMSVKDATGNLALTIEN